MEKIVFSVSIIILGIFSIIYDEKLTEMPAVIIVVAGIFAILYGSWNIFVCTLISRKHNVLREIGYYKAVSKKNLEYYEKLVEMVLFFSFLCLLIIIIIFLILSNESHLLGPILICICIAICSIRAYINYIKYRKKNM